MAMAQTADVMRTELEDLRAKMHAAMQATGHVPGKGTCEGASDREEGIEKLKSELQRLQGTVASLGKQMAEVLTVHLHPLPAHVPSHALSWLERT